MPISSEFRLPLVTSDGGVEDAVEQSNIKLDSANALLSSIDSRISTSNNTLSSIEDGIDTAIFAEIDGTSTLSSLKVTQDGYLLVKDSDVVGKEHISSHTSNITSTTQVYTPPSGKRLKITSITLSGFSGSLTDALIVRVSDTNGNFARFSAPEDILANTIPIDAHRTFPTPLSTSGTITLTVAQGTFSGDFSFSGFLEDS